MAETKSSFRDVLFERVKTWAASDENREDLSSLFDFVSKVALDSFRNGLAAGKGRTERPERRPVRIKGSALANGRLQPRVVPEK